jgi:hypothetical protein
MVSILRYNVRRERIRCWEWLVVELMMGKEQKPTTPGVPR